MRVALVHDLLLEYGGAERVLDAFLRLYPKANVYTFYFNANDPYLKKYQKKLVSTSFLTLIPGLNKLGRFFSVTKIFSWLYFYSLNLSKYDLIISSSHSYQSKIVSGGKNSLHISYIHTPPRYLYGDFHELGWMDIFPMKYILYPAIFLLKLVDRWAATRPNILIANSYRTQAKIKKYYSRESLVVYPPVCTVRKKSKVKKYFITQARLVKQKGIDLLITVCNALQIPLLVVGDGYYAASLKKIAKENIMFVGAVPEKKLAQLFANAKALLYAAHADDLGLVPLESLSRGIPVIGYYVGGMREILVDGINGVAFDKYSKKSLKDAIVRFNKMSLSSSDCIKSVKHFSFATFKRKILKVISSYES